jgi:hypothetical protein
MVGARDHYVFAMLMTMFTGGFGGLLMVVAWVQVLTEPPAEAHGRYRVPLLLFTAAICLATLGSAVATVLPYNQVTTAWTFALIFSFACVARNLFLLRRIDGPEKPAVQIGSIAVFLVDLIGLIGMTMALPGMPLNRMGA